MHILTKSSLHDNEVYIDKIALLITCLFVLFLVFWGWKAHPIETFGPEIDHYVEFAASIREGVLPDKEDPHVALHPLLYAILTTGVSFIVPDIFTAAKLVSNLMAGVLLFASYTLGRYVFNRKVALIALLFMATNFHVIINGVLATSDITSAAFAATTLLCAVRVQMQKEMLIDTILLSLSFSLAYFTRYPLVSLLPTIGISIVFSTKHSGKLLVKTLMLFVFATLIFLTPYFLISWSIFGNPIYNENWKNVAFKVYGNMDWSYFGRIPFHGLAEVILHSPSAFLKAGVRELAKFVHSGISGLVGLPPILAGLFFTSSYTTLYSMRKTKLLLLSFFVIYALGISFTFFTSARVMLPVLSICYLLIAEFLIEFDLKVHVKKFSLPPLFIFAIALCIVKIGVMIPDLQTFIKWHPIHEVEAAIQLEEQYGKDIVVMGTCLHYIVQRHVNYDYKELHYSFLRISREEQQDLALYYQELYRILQETNSDYLLIGELSMDRTIPSEQHVPQDLLRDNNVPSYLRLIHLDERLAIYAFNK